MLVGVAVSPPLPSPLWLFLAHSGPRCLTPALLPHPIWNLYCSEFQAATLPLPPLTLPLISVLRLKPSSSCLEAVGQLLKEYIRQENENYQKEL